MILHAAFDFPPGFAGRKNQTRLEFDTDTVVTA
jgi:hypothetical protein